MSLRILVERLWRGLLLSLVLGCGDDARLLGKKNTPKGAATTTGFGGGQGSQTAASSTSSDTAADSAGGEAAVSLGGSGATATGDAVSMASGTTGSNEQTGGVSDTTGGANSSGGSDGNTGSGGSAGQAGGTGGGATNRCTGIAPTCGPLGDTDCCASVLVPRGTFNRSNADDAPATVSDYRLDVFEVTVGRFRQFLADYPDNFPPAGSGKNPNDPTDPGWDEAWNGELQFPLPPDLTGCNPQRDQISWTDEPGPNESLPMTCLTWFEAFAFCVWDQGRLPTEAEWNYAAAGGSEQRYYPWSSPPDDTAIDESYAVYADAPLAVVGSKSPQGDGRWGHADLAGSVFEWVVDYADNYPVPCNDCAVHTPSEEAATMRIDRGGSVTHPASSLRTLYRGNFQASGGRTNVGVRCARAP